MKRSPSGYRRAWEEIGARTPNLGIANAALSQLSYIPTFAGRCDYATRLQTRAKRDRLFLAYSVPAN